MTSIATSLQDVLRDETLAGLALQSAPVWIFSADASRILFANAGGGAITGTSSLANVRDITLKPDDARASQIAKLAPALPHGGAPRLHRLRGFGLSFGRLLTCACSRISLNGADAILVAAAQPAGPNLSAAQRAQWLLADESAPLALFDNKGALLAATASAGIAEHATLESVKGGTQQTVGETGVTLINLGGVSSDSGPVSHAPESAGNVPMDDNGKRPEKLANEPERSDDLPARRHPLRFVWQTDEEGRFSLGSDEFTQLLGTPVATALGRPWAEISEALGVDPDGEVARALASRETWSGLTVEWPLDGVAARMPVELSGLPMFGRDRVFKGYRGFGVCRDLDLLTQLSAPSALSPAKDKAPFVPRIAADNAGAKQDRNIVRFPSADPKALSDSERTNFKQIGAELHARLNRARGNGESAKLVPAATIATIAATPPRDSDAQNLLDNLPTGVLVYRVEEMLYANPAFLRWSGHDDLGAFAQAGGLSALQVEFDDGAIADGKRLTLSAPGIQSTADAQLLTIDWDGGNAQALVLLAPSAAANTEGFDSSEIADLRAILDTATDGVAIIDGDGHILSANQSALALFGYDNGQITAMRFGDLFASESRLAILDYLNSLRDGRAGVMNEGRSVAGRVRQGGLVPLQLTLGRLAGSPPKFCAVFRDVSAWRKTEEELRTARSDAEKSLAEKSEFLGKISHQIRTPLNTMIGFAQVMMEGSLGDLGNERYRDYLKDIDASGKQVIALVDDLLNLSKIEAGKVDLTFAGLDLNALIKECVAGMQPQASRQRVIIRMALTDALPQVSADANAARQIVQGLLANSIKFAGAGGQVILSTAATGNDVVLRVRDTGTGMSDQDLEAALQPFRQMATSARLSPDDNGLGLPLAKALTEANRARFDIRSAVEAGTMVEIAFPTVRAAS